MITGPKMISGSKLEINPKSVKCPELAIVQSLGFGWEMVFDPKLKVSPKPVFGPNLGFGPHSVFNPNSRFSLTLLLDP